MTIRAAAHAAVCESESLMLLRRVQTANSSIRSACSLAEAGLTAYQTALKEQLPLAHIAEQTERPQYWFANNIVQVVGVYGKTPDDGDFVHLTREITGGLKLADDMAMLVASSEDKPRYEELRATKADIKKYMDWARTVY